MALQQNCATASETLINPSAAHRSIRHSLQDAGRPHERMAVASISTRAFGIARNDTPMVERAG